MVIGFKIGMIASMISSQSYQPLALRIVVVGSTGSGKTTLAAQLAEAFEIPHIELDALYWGPNWTEPPPEEFRQRVQAALNGPCWVTDGNYSTARDIIWQKATILVWLDYSLPLIWSRLFRRAFQRVYHQEELWNGNKESWRGQFFSRDSLFLYAYTSRQKHHKLYPAILSQPDYAHLKVHRFRAPRETETWLQYVGDG